MTGCLIAFVIAFAVALVVTSAVRSAALRLGVVDRPDKFRKIHQRAMPRLGGVAIYAAFAVPVLGLWLLSGSPVSNALRGQPAAVMSLVAGGAVALGIGIVDDIRGLRASRKLALQLLPAGIAMAGGFTISSVSTPFGEPLELGIFGAPLTLFWFLGCMNAFNLLDGLDGLAAGVCFFVGVTLLLVSALFQNAACLLLTCCLSGAVLGFLAFNFHPASIFLGDSGSMLLGFLIAALSLLGSRSSGTAVALLVPVTALGLPIFDTALAILRRWVLRLPIAAGDRKHVHHTLLSRGLSHRQVVLVLYLISAALGCAALTIAAGGRAAAAIVIAALGVAAVVGVRTFGGIRFTHLRDRLTAELARRGRTAEAKVSVERVVSQMGAASNAEVLWRAFSEGLESLDLDRARLRMFGRSGSLDRVFTWRNNGNGRRHRTALRRDRWGARLEVRNNGHVLGELELGKATQDAPLLPEAPELVDRLRYEMAVQIERLAGDDNGR